MPPKTIALTLYSEEEAKWLLPAAVDLAAQFRAHLVGVFPSHEVVVFAGPYGGMDAGVTTVLDERRQQELEAVTTRFAEATRAQDFASEFRAQEGVADSIESFVLGNVRSADVILAGRSYEDSPSHQSRMLEQVIRNSGRPVLVIPRDWKPAAIGRHVLIGWSDTREAARAAHDALSLASPKAAIDFLYANGRSGDEDAYRQDMAAAFDRLGHEVTLLDRDASSREAGQALIDVAGERGADLIAVGAFGHSRAYDFVIGAVTFYLLEHAAIPVLFSK
jgi:nucleotide-binding universal stress UspA family protein